MIDSDLGSEEDVKVEAAPPRRQAAMSSMDLMMAGPDPPQLGPTPGSNQHNGPSVLLNVHL